MTEPGEDVHKDLAFLKALVSEGPKAQGAAGIVCPAQALSRMTTSKPTSMQRSAGC